MLILDLQGMPHHTVVVYILGYDFLFKSSQGRCVFSKVFESQWNPNQKQMLKQSTPSWPVSSKLHLWGTHYIVYAQ